MCVSENCGQNSIICFDENCSVCIKSHQSCELSRVNHFVNRITEKRERAIPGKQAFVDKYNNIYDELIEQLSKDRDEFLEESYFIGLT